MHAEVYFCAKPAMKIVLLYLDSYIPLIPLPPLTFPYGDANNLLFLFCVKKSWVIFSDEALNLLCVKSILNANGKPVLAGIYNQFFFQMIFSISCVHSTKQQGKTFRMFLYATNNLLKRF